MGQKIPVTVITGFLGSGKTTLLNQLLSDGIKTAVVINEFGTTPVDQDLLQEQNLPLTVLSGGCLCCQVKGALAPTLKNLYMAWSSSSPKLFDRVIIETSGVASPEPIIDTLLREPWIAKHFTLKQILTTLAVPSAMEHMERFPEARSQVVWADKLLLTHADLADAGQSDAVLGLLNKLSPGTPQLTVTLGNIPVAALYEESGIGLRRLPNAELAPEHSFSSLSVYFERLPDWPRLQSILLDLLARYPNLLRLKGVMYLPDQAQPLAVQAAAGRLYPPQALPLQDGKDRRSRLVLIVSSGIEVLADELALLFVDYLDKNSIRFN